MILYKVTDRVEVKIEGITFKISPLSQAQKNELQGHMMKAVNGDMEEAMISVRKSLSFCLKDMKGVEYYDGDEKREYSLQFEDGNLTAECLDDLLNLPISQKISTVCAAFLQGVPSEIVDKDGKEIEGISIVKRKDSRKKK